MTALNSFKYENGDYVINGMALLSRLAKHENVDASVRPAIECQPLAIERLLGAERPDLSFDFTALYLCGMCGGYESPIGTKVAIEDEIVTWSEMGWCTDMNEMADCQPFEKVSGFKFSKAQYLGALEDARIYGIS